MSNIFITRHYIYKTPNDFPQQKKNNHIDKKHSENNQNDV